MFHFCVLDRCSDSCITLTSAIGRKAGIGVDDGRDKLFRFDMCSVTELPSQTDSAWVQLLSSYISRCSVWPERLVKETETMQPLA